MASNPPANCCTTGVKHEGEPTGKMIKIGEHDAYLATPSPANAHKTKAILYVPDVIGIWTNSMLLADRFAAQGYTTVIIDLFKGDAIPMNKFAGTDLMGWVNNGFDGKSPHLPEQIDPIVAQAVSYLRNDLGFRSVGAAGYCFGAKYVIRHYESGIDVGYIAHPSFVEEEEVAAVPGPLSIAAAETDAVFPVEKRMRTEEILKKNGAVYQMNLYSGVEHGFAVRRGLTEKVQRFAMDQAFRQAVAFMDCWLD